MKKNIQIISLFIFAFVLLSCSGNKSETYANDKISTQKVEQSNGVFKIVKIYNIDDDAFIQGIYYKNDFLYISTGLIPKSSLRKYNLKTQSEDMDLLVPFYFCEGIAEYKNNIYQLTWQDERCLVYDESNFKKIKEFKYDGEGWGICSDSNYLYMSNGTSEIKVIDPNTFRTLKTIKTYNEKGLPLYNLNELELINGDFWVNVWTEDYIYVIDKNSGMLKNKYDFSLLRNYIKNNPKAEVLNGIAYNPNNGHLFITGKQWGKIFEIELL